MMLKSENVDMASIITNDDADMVQYMTFMAIVFDSIILTFFRIRVINIFGIKYYYFHITFPS